MSKRDGSMWIVTDTIADRQYIAETSWTISRGRNTYGYNICTLRVDGKRVASCNGGGYDMTGTVVGMWISEAFQGRLKDLPPHSVWSVIPFNPKPAMKKSKDTYGLTHHIDASGKVAQATLDGACGITSMLRIGEMIGLKFDSKG